MLSYAGATVTEIAYGHRINSFDDEFFRLGEVWCRVAGIGTRPSLLDIHPACEYKVEKTPYTHNYEAYCEFMSRSCAPAILGSWCMVRRVHQR